MTTQSEFDVFLSYNKKDLSQVSYIASWLKENRIVVWFDEWEIGAGQSWIEVIQQGIKRSNSAAVFWGPSGLGDWQNREMQSILIDKSQKTSKIIPVLLPGCISESEMPPFLKIFSWIDFQNGLDDEVKKNQLLESIKNQGISNFRSPLELFEHLESEILKKLYYLRDKHLLEVAGSNKYKLEKEIEALENQLTDTRNRIKQLSKE